MKLEWQNGNDSDTPYLDRIQEMNAWLKSIKDYILNEPEEKKEEIFLGGFED